MELKEYQQKVIDRLTTYLEALRDCRNDPAASSPLFNACDAAWEVLVRSGSIPQFHHRGQASQPPYLDYRDGTGHPFPNVCLKVPTAGGKTLLATHGLERILLRLERRQVGLVLWIVPTSAIYEQTLAAFRDRAHPYRHVLERAAHGRLLILEKSDRFSALDVAEKLCVMVLMIQSISRSHETKESLRSVRDTGNFLSFFPDADNAEGNARLLDAIPNLDTVEPDDTAPQPFSVVRQSLVNVIRQLRPIVVVDEAHKFKGELAMETVRHLNPSFVLEITATPNMTAHESNVLVSVPGLDLKAEEMIKVPINVTNLADSDWQHTLRAAAQQRDQLEVSSLSLYAKTGRYVRPIALVRVDRVDGTARAGEVHADAVRAFLIDTLGIPPEQVKLKTSKVDEIAGIDLYSEHCPVRYIITKDALREGWDCHFAYVLALLSRTTALTAMTQMIGRVLRQPGARLTNLQSLDQCYVFAFDQDVSEAVESVRKGLEQEGMADVAGMIRTTTPGASADIQTVTLKRRAHLVTTRIALPQVLHADDVGYRPISYERDVLAELPWASFFYRNAASVPIKQHTSSTTTSQVDVTGLSRTPALPLPWIASLPTAATDLDLPFLVRQVMELVPHAWQASRIVMEALPVLRRRASPHHLFAARLDIIADMLHDLQQQIDTAAERLFREKVATGDIRFHLQISADPKLDWQLAEQYSVDIAADGAPWLTNRRGDPVTRSVFEKVPRADLNDLERNVALYLDDDAAVSWWHRLAARQDYAVQGWQRNKVYPDFLALITADGNTGTLTLLETKGEHLKGNDDTIYKTKLFQLLSSLAAHGMTAGEVVLDTAASHITFKILLEDTWHSLLSDLASKTA